MFCNWINSRFIAAGVSFDTILEATGREKTFKPMMAEGIKFDISQKQKSKAKVVVYLIKKKLINIFNILKYKNIKYILLQIFLFVIKFHFFFLLFIY